MEAVEKVVHIIQVSYILQSEVAQVIFYYLNTYTEDLVAEFSVLEHLCGRPLTSVGSGKLTEVVNA